MKVISGLSSQPKQNQSIQLDDGSLVTLYLEYRQQQIGWFFDFSYNGVDYQGLRMTSFPNVLRQWQNVIPFGIGVMTAGNADPLNVTDLADGTTTLYLLNADDVAAVEAAMGRT